MIVSLFKDYKSVTNPPLKVDITTILNRVKNGHHKEIIDNIRKEPDKKKRSELKKKLPCVVFSGVLGKGISKTNKQTGNSYISYREDKSLTEHSGLCVVDLDDLGYDDVKLSTYKKTLSQLFPSILSIFISPSGNGLKVVFRIPQNIKSHRSHYKAILADLEKEGCEVDSTSINEARLSFESYDPDIYINLEATEYTDFILEEEAPLEAPLVAPLQQNNLTDYRKLSIAATMIDNAPDGFKHHTLIKAAYLLGGYISSGIVDEREAVEMLRKRISAKNIDDKDGAFKTIDDGIAKGKLKPIYEIEEIENEFKTYLSRKEFEDDERGFSFLSDSGKIDKMLEEYLVNGEQEGLPTNFKQLDSHFRFKPNSFNVILGHDNVGKSFMIWFLATVASCLHEWKWIIYSPENKTHRIKKQLIDFVLGVKAEQVSKVKFNKAKKFVDQHFYFIRKDKEHTIFDLLNYGAVLCEKDPKIKGFMIDPYNSIALDYKDKGQGLSAYEYHLKAATNMRIFAEKYCSIYLNAHSVTGSRRGQLDADGILKRPRKDDIEQGGLWANRCDDFIVIHRKVKSEDEWMFTEIHVDKVKDVETGGGVTYADPIKLKLMYFSEFVDEDGKSALESFRKDFFKVGTQGSLPLKNPNEAFKS